MMFKGPILSLLVGFAVSGCVADSNKQFSDTGVSSSHQRVKTSVASRNNPKFSWYWSEYDANNGNVSGAFERVSFSGPDYVIIVHKLIPLSEPIPSDIQELGDKYCARSGKKATISEFNGRDINVVSYQCMFSGEQLES
ncbi:hypothetical protein O4H49_04870 [Kiloniella laminariae]|uniref:Lipoprotein n=1 Tax=Kiloniella laminariae TaxID=454162 RepID=A0ABT4LGM4_9PROT|nr:hypothetical protein [Kiloniella laminariae]MCZ4280095.1 hypothetical protein [Kiloniella laminariae]